MLCMARAIARNGRCCSCFCCFFCYLKCVCCPVPCSCRCTHGLRACLFSHPLACLPACFLPDCLRDSLNVLFAAYAAASSHAAIALLLDIEACAGARRDWLTCLMMHTRTRPLRERSNNPSLYFFPLAGAAWSSPNPVMPCHCSTSL
jgi:hypothetical protein